MSIFQEANIARLENEDILYESKYGIRMEGSLGTPVYLIITTKRIITFQDVSLLNPKNIIFRFLPFSRLWIKKEWKIKDYCSSDELVSIERCKNGFNNKLLKFIKSDSKNFTLGLGDGKNFDVFFNIIENMLKQSGKQLTKTTDTIWNVA